MQNLLNDNDRVIELAALTVNGVFVGFFNGTDDAAFKLKINQANVWNCLSGKKVSTNGYIFIKKEKYDPLMKISRDSILRKRKFLKSK